MLNVELFLDGITNIFSCPEYNDIEKAKVFLEMVGQKKHFTDVLMNRENGVIITIGNENTEDIQVPEFRIKGLGNYQPTDP
jgi:heat-inducible transcriptional repressor